MALELGAAESAAIESAPAQTPVVESAEQNGTAAVESPSPAAGVPPTPDPQAEVAALSAEFGVDLSTFPDAASARAALRWQAEQAANAGLDAVMQFRQPAQVGGPVSQAPDQPPLGAAPPVAPTAAQPVDLAALGLDEAEPAAKAIRALEQQLANGGTTAAALAARLDAMEAQTRAAAHRDLQTQAASYVDSLQSPRYGTSKSRTAAQRTAAAQLFDVADAILYGDVQHGRPVPTVQNRLARAHLILESGQAPSAPAVTAPAPLPQTASPAASPPGGGVEGVRMNERWADNPRMLAALGVG